jgi:coatomer subunit zeta
MSVSIPGVNCFLILNTEGERILAKYYDDRKKDDQIKNEASLHRKTKSFKVGQDTEVFLVENEVVALRAGADCKFYLSAPVEENELILVAVLDAIFDALCEIFNNHIDQRTIMENLELMLLTVDEVIDHGQIFELDTKAVASRVLMRSTEASGDTRAIGDLSLSQAMLLAKDQLIKTLATSGRENY